MPSIFRQTLLLILLFPAALLAGSATHNLNFEHFGIRQGLPQTQVRAIHQDATGYLWVGTYGGVGRYNGRTFARFSTVEGLASNTIEAISSTSDGRVWVGTTKGLCFKTREASRFDCLDQEPIVDAHVQALLPDQSGGIWIGTASGLFHLEADDSLREIMLPGNVSADTLALERAASGREGADFWIGTRNGLFLRTANGELEEIDLPATTLGIITSLADGGDQLWIGSVAGLFTLTGGKVQLVDDLPSDWSVDDVNAIAQDANGTIWAATDQGILLETASGFELLTRNNGLKSEITFTVFADREGVIWVGHDDGLSSYTPGPFSGYTEENGLLHYFVRTINEDSSGRLWLGTRNGVQVVPYRDGEWQFNDSKKIVAADGLSDTRVYSIAISTPDEAWLATGDGVVLWQEGKGVVEKFDLQDGLPTSATQAVLLQGEDLWIGSNRGVRVMRDGKIEMPPSDLLGKAYVYRIRRDTMGRLWFGSQDLGVFMLDNNGEVKQFTAEDGLTYESIWDIAPDQHGGVWIGSNGDGLFHFKSNGEIDQFTEKDGLADNFVWQVLVDDKGNVWSYTNRGLSRFDGNGFKNFGLEDGLLHLEGGATGAWQSHDGSLWFASADGLMRYESHREDSRDAPPRVIIEEVTLGEETISNHSELDYTSATIHFRYAALSYQAADQLLYRYRLRGADEEWSKPTEYQPVNFANLGGGDYVFEVIARNPNSDWSKSPAQFHFRIAPAYWETYWFWLLAATLSALLIGAAFRMRIHQIQAHRRELEELVASRTEELKHANEKLQEASVTDPLTGLHNRRFLSTQIRTDVAQSRRQYREDGLFPNRDIVFMMVDIDFFKEVNDTYGHGAGDRVLRQFACLLNKLMRESDYTVRWGGEEFLIVARQTEATQADVIAKRIMQAVRDARFVIDDNGNTVSCTCSVGVSHFPFLRKRPDAMSWEQVVDISDIAVYMAKLLGRDGWVSISGTDALDAGDGRTILEDIRNDLRGLVRRGMIEVCSSYEDPLAVTLDKDED